MAKHDSGYKLLFSHAQMVEDLLKGFVREEWVEKLDFSTLEKVNGSYVSDDLRQRADDVVWRVRWGEDWLYVYLLIEFQSTVDSWMAVRMMTYVGLLYQDLIESKQLTAGKKLPPVLPVVLYNGDSEWAAATDIRELIAEVTGGLSLYQPQMQYLLVAERDYNDADLGKLKNLVAALFRLENSHNPELLLEVLTSLLAWLGSESQDSLRRAFTVWFSRVLFPSRFESEDLPVMENLYEVKTMLAERMEEWKENYRQEGLEEGLEKGLEKGLQKGALRLLIRQFEMKFGKLPADIEVRLNQADEEQIFLWSERILTAKTLGEIFGH
jgi:predicted transposase/invertase (TIGR01784 family)